MKNIETPAVYLVTFAAPRASSRARKRFLVTIAVCASTEAEAIVLARPDAPTGGEFLEAERLDGPVTVQTHGADAAHVDARLAARAAERGTDPRLACPGCGSNLVTDPICPPVPSRACDFRASCPDCSDDEEGPFGYGSTPQHAGADFAESLELRKA